MVSIHDATKEGVRLNSMQLRHSLSVHCSADDVLTAFMAIGEAIRSRCRRFQKDSLTQGEACELALRLKEQRQLVQQLAAEVDIQRVRQLLRLHRRHCGKLLKLAVWLGSILR